MYHGRPNWETGEGWGGGEQVIGCLMFLHAKKHCQTAKKKLGNAQNNIPQLSPTYGVCVCVWVPWELHEKKKKKKKKNLSSN